ncbi:MAG: hypothetical protein H0U76_24250 [Ktedonobacteraceae bacterium]|nr:hypothetical protein [Ktedonobacteraceae bacterium]
MNCGFCGIALQQGAGHCPSCGSPILYREQEPEQPIQHATPFSLQQSDKRRVANGYTPLQLPSSKLSSYKPASLPSNDPTPTPPVSNPPSFHSGSMPGITLGSRLSQYGQASTKPSKLSDYKQLSAPRSKLSDYKTGANQNSGPIPHHTPPASMPTPGLTSFHAATPAPSGTQTLYVQTTNASSMPNAASISNPANPSPFALTGGGYVAHPVLPTGASPIDMPMKGRGKSGGWLMGGIAVLLLIVCVGAASFFFLQRTNNVKHVADATKTVATPVPTVAPIHGPSGNMSVPAISALFSSPRMTAAIDESDKARQTTSMYTTGQTVYVTFNLNSKGQKGYVRARWYKGKQLFHEVDLAHDPGKTNSYFSIVYDTPATDGSVELYWSTTANFSDAKLARVAHFTVVAS